MRSFQRSISPTSRCGRRSAAAPAPGGGRASSARLAAMMALSLHTARRACLSTSSGAVQRPVKPGDRRSYTSLGGWMGELGEVGKGG